MRPRIQHIIDGMRERDIPPKRRNGAGNRGIEPRQFVHQLPGALHQGLIAQPVRGAFLIRTGKQHAVVSREPQVVRGRFAVGQERRLLAQLRPDRGRQRFGQHRIAIFVLQVTLERLEQAGGLANADDQVRGRDRAAIEKCSGRLAIEGDPGDARPLVDLDALLDRRLQEPHGQLVGIHEAPIGQLHSTRRLKRRLALHHRGRHPRRTQSRLFARGQFPLQQLVRAAGR